MEAILSRTTSSLASWISSVGSSDAQLDRLDGPLSNCGVVVGASSHCSLILMIESRGIRRAGTREPFL